jgi:hypothetical protein
MKRLAAVAVLGLWAAAAHAQCRSNPLTVALLTTGGVNAGMVTVSNDSTNIYVMFTATGGFTISQLDVEVGGSVSSLSPDPRQFPFHQSFCPAVTTYTFTIPIPPGTAFNTSVAVAAHATLNSPTGGSVDAWGSGQLFPGEKACSTSCGCDDDGDGDGGHGGDSAKHPGDNHGGGDGGGDHCGGDLSHKLARLMPGSALNGGGDGGGGGDQHCGDHSKHKKAAAPLAGVLHDGGGQQCGGGGHGDSQGSVLNHDGGGSGGGDDDGDDDEGGSGQGCGAMYFLYTVQCILNE